MNKKQLQLIKGIIASNKDFGHILDSIYSSDKILLSPSLRNSTINLSSGTSSYFAFDEYTKQISEDFLNAKYYRDYSSPQGSETLREILAYKENLRHKKGVYDKSNICLTNGATDAVTNVLKWIKKEYPHGEILILNPSYYLFKHVSKKINLKFKEIDNNKKSLELLIKNLNKTVNKNTKLLIVTYPNNPTGEVYSEEKIDQIIKFCKSKNIFILFDEAFSGLIFKSSFTKPDILACNQNYLQNIVCIYSYSKNENLPGLRSGYAISINERLIKYLADQIEIESFFASASNYKGFIILHTVLTSIELLELKNKSLKTIINNVYKEISKLTQIKYTKNELESIYLRYKNYRKDSLHWYSENYDACIKALGNNNTYVYPKESAFNTFVHLNMLDHVDTLNFCVNLYLETGIKIMPGPCFGFNQKYWESKNIGFWLRLSFSIETSILEDGIKRLNEFTDKYLANESKYLSWKIF